LVYSAGFFFLMRPICFFDLPPSFSFYHF